MTVNRRTFLSGMVAASAVGASRRSRGGTEAPAGERRNVLLVTADGIRWQEMFGGADASLLNREAGKVAEVERLRQAFWHDDPVERRRRLLPFLWSEVAERGQLIGNRERGSQVNVSNGKNFSYPGYSELLTGRADPRVDSNDKVPNPNINVLEWLVRESGGAVGVAAFGSWDLFPYILNAERSGLPVNAGWEPIAGEELRGRERLLNSLMRQLPRPYGDAVRLDGLTLGVALAYLKRHRPQVVYLSLGETDDAAHQGRYDHYLEAARHFDACVEELWTTVQRWPEYRGTTHLVLATDHGRGNGPDDWTSHGATVAGSEAVWLGLLGPEAAATGERSGPHEPLILAQTAATVAELAGYPGFVAKNPGVAPALEYGAPGAS